MTIERLGPVDPIQKFNKPDKVVRAKPRDAGDSISVSEEAKLRSEMLRAAEQVRSLPDIREDRVAEVKQKIEDPSYLDQAVFGAVADELMTQFGI